MSLDKHVQKRANPRAESQSHVSSHCSARLRDGNILLYYVLIIFFIVLTIHCIPKKIRIRIRRKHFYFVFLRFEISYLQQF